jgi:uncharacterized protein (DUF4415 family)
MGMGNEFADRLPRELQEARERHAPAIPDFLRRTANNASEPTPSPQQSIPDFETFKRQMSEGNIFEPFKPPVEDKPISNVPSKVDDDDDDDDLGFDVDELVKKIDAKIAELEEEEKRNKEAQEKEKNDEEDKAPIESDEKVSNEVKEEKKEQVNLKLDDSEDDDDFFDDFFDE